MKIVKTDNLDRGTVPEEVVASGIPDERYANVMCGALNNRFSGDYADDYFKVVPDDYVPDPGFQP